MTLCFFMKTKRSYLNVKKHLINGYFIRYWIRILTRKTRIAPTLGGTELELSEPDFSKTSGFYFLGFTIKQFKRKFLGLNGIDIIINNYTF